MFTCLMMMSTRNVFVCNTLDGRLWTDDNLTAKGLSGGGYTYEYKGATSLVACTVRNL